jgi:transposase
LRRNREEYGIARLANVILLLDNGKSCAKIVEFLYLDDDTIRNWCKAFPQEGWDAVALNGWQGGQSRLTPDKETKLTARLEDRFCHSAGEIRAFITAAFGLGYSHLGCPMVLGVKSQHLVDRL